MQVGLDTCRPQDGIPINPERQLGARHGLLVFWPFLFERLNRPRCIEWAVGRFARQMAQQHRLKAGPLPEDHDSVVGGELACSLGALWIALSLVRVQKCEASHGRTALLLEQLQAQTNSAFQCKVVSKAPLQAMKDWHKLRTELFRKQPYYLAGCDT